MSTLTLAIARTGVLAGLSAGLIIAGYWHFSRQAHERALAEVRAINERLEAQLAERDEMIERLSRSRRVAHLHIVGQRPTEPGTTETEVLFIELDDAGSELDRQSFTIPGGVLFVDGWTVKFDADDVADGHLMRGRTMLLLRRIYSEEMAPVDGYEIDTPGAVPPAYAASDAGVFERRIWKNFWDIATRPGVADDLGVRVAQGEVVYKPVTAGERYELILDAVGGLSLMPLEPESDGESIHG